MDLRLIPKLILQNDQSDMQTIQKDTNGHENFLNLALRSCKHSPVSRNAYQASVTSFDGSIISTSALPCVVGALCLIENSYGRETTGEVVRIHRDSLEIIPHDTKCPIQIGDQVTLLQSRQEVEVGEAYFC